MQWNEISETILNAKIIYIERGKVFFQASEHDLQKIQRLRTAGLIFLLIYFEDFENPKFYQQDKEVLVAYIKNVAAEKLNYTKILKLWQANLKFQSLPFVKNPLYEIVDEKLSFDFVDPENEGQKLNPEILSDMELKAVERFVTEKAEILGLDLPEQLAAEIQKYKTTATEPKFKTEGNRFGKSQNINTQETNKILGGSINDASHWDFDLIHPTARFNHNIGENSFRVALELSKDKTGLFNRNITFFGKTPTKNSIVSGMLQMADLQPYEVVYDPMCGVGSIPIEVATYLSKGPFPLILGSDIWEPCLKSFAGNLRAFSLRFSELFWPGPAKTGSQTQRRKQHK